METVNKVPEDFGALNGTEVSNKNTLFQELDTFFGKSPNVEYIFVRPLSSVNLFSTGIGLHYNSYGHSAVRYKLQGKWYVMNIIGKEEKNGINMVTFCSPEEYFFSTKYNDDVGCSQQRGLYNRSMVGIRLYDVPEDKIEKMHQVFLQTQERNKNGDAGFIIVPQVYPILRFWNKYVLGKKIPELGNCIFWTSKGLLEAGLVTNYTNWPKSTLINIIENSKYEYDVVSYRRIEHAKLSYGIKASPLELVAPFNTVRSILYLFPENFARAIVEVKPGTIEAVIKRHEPLQMKSNLRNLLNGTLLVSGSVIIMSYFSYRFFRYTYKGGKSWATWATKYETWRGSSSLNKSNVGPKANANIGRSFGKPFIGLRKLFRIFRK